MTTIYGAHALYCGVCHKAPEHCRCDVFMQWWAGDPMDCPHCRRPFAVCFADVQGCGTTPARDEEAKPQTWRDRPPLA